MEISVVIPVYNEKNLIEQVLRELYEEVLSRFSNYEVIVINDASTDGTEEVLNKLKKELSDLEIITFTKNQGHGPAIRKGFELAQGEFVFHNDSDGQHQMKEFWKLWPLRDKADLIVGIRKHRNDPLPRIIGSRILRYLIFFLFGIYLKDANSPFKIIRSSFLKRCLNIVAPNVFAPSILFSITARYLKVRMIEIPVMHRIRQGGKSVLNFKRILKAAKRCWCDLLDLHKKLKTVER